MRQEHVRSPDFFLVEIETIDFEQVGAVKLDGSRLLLRVFLQRQGACPIVVAKLVVPSATGVALLEAADPLVDLSHAGGAGLDAPQKPVRVSQKPGLLLFSDGAILLFPALAVAEQVDRIADPPLLERRQAATPGVRLGLTSAETG